MRLILNSFIILLTSLFLFSFQSKAQTSDPTSISVPKEEIDTDELYEMEKITVVPTQSKLPSESVPASVVVIESNDLDEKQAENLEDSLRGQAGVQVTGGPRSTVQVPQIRGFDAKRVILTVDGVRQNFNSEHSGKVFLDPELIKRLEVVKGPQSPLYGSGALGGVVAFSTKSAHDFLESGKNLGAMVKVGYQSVRDQGMGTLAAFGRNKYVDALAMITGRDGTDIRLPEGKTLPYSSANKQNVFLKAGANFTTNQRLEWSLNSYSSETLSPLNPTQPADPTGNQTGDIVDEQDQYTLNYRFNPDSQSVDLSANAFYNVVNVEKTRSSDGRFEERRLETVGTEVFNHFRFGSEDFKNISTVGVEFFEDRTIGTRNGAPLGNYPKGLGQTTAAYFQHHVRVFDKFSVSPGFRYDRYSVNNRNGLSRDDEELTGKFSVDYSMTENSLAYASFAQGFNSPRIQDMYTNGLHFPGFGPNPPNFFVPNPNLDSERSETYELGVKVFGDTLFAKDDTPSVEISVFETQAEDFINRSVDIPGGTTTFVNADNVRLQGYEAALGYEWSRLRSIVNYTQIRSLDKNSGDPINDTPADTWNFILSYKLLGNRNLTLGYLGTFAEAQDRVDANGQATNDYFVHDIFATFQPKVQWLKGSELGLRVNNIMDKAYRRHGSVLPEPGRDIRVSLKYTL